MKLFSWTIINDEIEFVEDLINWHLQFLDGMVIIDNGSKDGTWEYLQSLNNPKVIVEKYHTEYRPQYEKSWETMDKNRIFPESIVRNHAIARAKEIFETDSENWLIQIDADEIFLPKVREIIEENANYLSISCSTINPCCELKWHPIEQRRGKDGQYIKVFDPHARIWRADANISYIKNYELADCNYHCVPVLNGKKPHLFETRSNVFVPDLIHFHLHWMYSKKLYDFYFNKGITDLQEIKNNNPLNEVSNLVPERFLQRREEWYKMKWFDFENFTIEYFGDKLEVEIIVNDKIQPDINWIKFIERMVQNENNSK